MKYILALISATIVISNAQASSLDELLNQQTSEKIQPVEISGVGIFTSSAAGVCTMLGFTRMVSFEIDHCSDSETVVLLNGTGGASYVAMKDNCKHQGGTKIKSVTCAK